MAENKLVTGTEHKQGNHKRLKVIGLVLVAALAGALGIISYYAYQDSHYIITENAKVTGEMVKITPPVPGILAEWKVNTGSRVTKGQVLGKQQISGAGERADRGSVLLQEIRSPLDGTVIKSEAKVGTTVAPGQVLAVVADLDSLYIEANIKETEINKVKVGQLVDVTLDAAKNVQLQGKVDFIGLATTSVFSLLPDVNSGNGFTKVTRVIPVRISLLELPAVQLKLLPGMSATVRIHLK